MKTKLPVFNYRDIDGSWIAFERRMLYELGLIHQISSLSKQSMTGMTVYIDMEFDSEVLIEALAKFDIELKMIDKFEQRSFVRNLENYKPEL